MKQARSCKGCRQRDARIAALEARVGRLEEQLAAARKDSSTSSKRPSSDLGKGQPARDEPNTGRPPGGQPGHPKHDRPPLPPELIQLVVPHELDVCPDCQGPLQRNGDLVTTVEQVDIQQVPLAAEQHLFPEYWCDQCGKAHKAALPQHLQQGGLVGPELTTLIAFLKGVCHASFSTIRTFVRDVVGLTLSRSFLRKVVGKVSAALAAPYQDLLDRLPDAAVLNVDETSHPDNGERWWTWCFRAELYTLYHIDAYRNGDVLLNLLGQEFAGVLGCDYFGAYRRYMRECSIQVQFCLAHLIRDVKYLTTLPDAATQAYGQRLRQALRDLFAVVAQAEVLPAAQHTRRLQAARQQVLAAGLEQVPHTRAAQNLAARLRKHGAAYFTFITTPNIEPTNNLAEQAIRFVVIDRHITQGTRSAGGREWCERIWTVIATCTQQGLSVYDYLRTAVAHWFVGEAAPPLLAETPA